MIVKPIEKLYGEAGNKFTANNLRISNIKANIGNKEYVECKFKELSMNLERCDLDNVMNILVDDLFYEMIDSSFITNLYDAYSRSSEKDIFISNLKESYKLRGVNSISVAWTPIIRRQQ